jgi:hypothetical protein
MDNNPAPELTDPKRSEYIKILTPLFMEAEVASTMWATIWLADLECLRSAAERAKNKANHISTIIEFDRKEQMNYALKTCKYVPWIISVYTNRSSFQGKQETDQLRIPKKRTPKSGNKKKQSLHLNRNIQN